MRFSAYVLKLTFILLVPFTLIVSKAEAQKDTTQTTSTSEQAPAIESQWNYSSSTDEMSGKMRKMAIVQSTNAVELNFPYEGAQRGLIGLAKTGKDWFVIFSIEKGQLACDGLTSCPLFVKFDEDEPTYFRTSGTSFSSTTQLTILDHKRFISRMRVAKIVRIQPSLYQEVAVVFRFNVEGFLPERLEGR